MNFYYKCASILDSLDAKQGSIKSLVATLPEADRKRGAALVIETLKCAFGQTCKGLPKTLLTCRTTSIDRPVLLDVINASKLLEQEKKHLSKQNLVLPLVHDVLLGKGIQAGDGPIKQAVLRHKTRMKAELVMVKVKRGVARDEDLASQSDSLISPRWVRINTNVSTKEAVTGILRRRGFIHQHAVEE
jgi:putative methyltransferase